MQSDADPEKQTHVYLHFLSPKDCVKMTSMFNIENAFFARKSEPWNSGRAVAYRSTCNDAM